VNSHPLTNNSAVAAQHSREQPIEAMFAARKIALIGATESQGTVGHSLMVNLTSDKFNGVLYPVNPKRDTVLGVKAYPNIASVPETPDLAIIVVPAKAVPGVIRECGDAGVRQAIIISAGFKEAGEEGLALERKLVATARECNVRFLGPNCLGVVNLHRNMNASFAPAWPPPGKISVISQSGALCVAILDWAASMQLGLSKIVSFGNKADLNEVDLLTALGRDPQTSVIVAYLESITEGDAFMEVAEETAKTKPVVVLKVGVTQAGARAASSHTGSLAGADMAYWAAFRRSGVIRAENFEALFDYALAFSTQPLPEGERVAIITNAGGPGIMAADAAELVGLSMKAPTAETQEKLRAGIPAAAAVGNPIDVIGDAGPERYIHSLEHVQKDPNIDSIVVVVTPTY
jgi:acetyltransferase